MKILLVTHTIDPTSGGWGRYSHDLKKALEAEGHTVSTLSDCARYPLANPVRYLRSPTSFFVHDYWALRKALVTTQPDVVHITVEPYFLFIPFLPIRKARIVLTVHGTYAYLPMQVLWPWRRIARNLFSRALRQVWRIIAVSDYTKKHLLTEAENNKVLLNIGRITTIHNGINVANYTYRDAPESEGEVKRILTVAPVKSRKGIVEAVQALGAYKEKYGGAFAYRIIGSYDPNSAYTRALCEEIRTLGLGEAVSFLGRVSEESLQEEYARADVFLMLPVRSSVRAFEGFGLVYLEANACGVPTIGSREGGSAEAIKDGVSGLVVDAGNAEEVAERIHDVLQSVRVKRVDARLWAEEHDISKVAQRIVALYS